MARVPGLPDEGRYIIHAIRRNYFDDGRNLASNLSQLISPRLIVALFPYYYKKKFLKMPTRENNASADEMEQPLPPVPLTPRRQTGDSRLASDFRPVNGFGEL